MPVVALFNAGAAACSRALHIATVAALICALPAIADAARIVPAGASGDVIFQSGFEADVGVLLQGSSETPAIEATIDMAPLAAAESSVDNGLIMTRLDVWLSRTATVGQVNGALTAIHGGIVTMMPNRAEITVGIPRPASHEELRQVQQVLNGSPGILHAGLGHIAEPTGSPRDPAAGADMSYLSASRFPAAWHVRRLATTGCEARKVEMRFVDYFGNRTLPPYPTFEQEVPGFTVLNRMLGDSEQLHGYEVVSIAAARLDDLNPTGANPFPQCLNIQGVTVAGLTGVQAEYVATRDWPAGHFLLNESLGGSHPPCVGGCSAAEIEDYRQLPIDRAMQALAWRSMTAVNEGDLLVSTSAGNSNDAEAALVYPYFREAEFVNHLGTAASPRMFSDTVDLAYLRDHSLLDPLPPFTFLPSLYPSDEEIQRVAQYELETFGGMLGNPVSNILTVGATTNQADASMVRESVFSNIHPSVHAVGEHVKGFSQDPSQQNLAGTSASAPQVAGLVSYLWLLSPDLRTRPLDDTIATVVANTRRVGDNVSLIDAYASVLALDEASATVLPTAQSMPIRLALLDLDDNGTFDDDDLRPLAAELIDHYVANGEPQEQDWGRMDLNGDGYVGGGRITRFDLDRRGSTQYGSTDYSTNITQQIENATVHFSETTVTDLNVLCYYAYSPLFAGSAAERTRLLATTCASQYQPGLHDLGRDWETMMSNDRIVYGGSTHWAFDQSGIYGMWVREFDRITHQFSEVRQLAPMRTVPPIQPDVYPKAFDLAVSRTGDAVVAWSGFTGGLWTSRYDPLAAQWTDAQLVGPLLGGQPQVVMDERGNAMVTALGYDSEHQAYALAWTRFDQGVGQWTAPALLPISNGEGRSGAAPPAPASDGRSTRYRTLAASHDGTVFAVFGPTRIYRYSSALGTWTTISAATTDTAYQYSIVASDPGDLLFVWKDTANELHSRLLHHDDGQWGPVRPIATGDVSSNFVLVGDGAGNAIATWNVFDPTSNGSPQHVWSSYYRIASDLWGEPVRVDESGNGIGGDYHVSMARTTGSARIVFPQDQADISFPYAAIADVASKRFDPLSGWGPLESIESGYEFRAQWQSMTMSDDGIAFINHGRSSWNEATGGVTEYVWLIRP